MKLALIQMHVIPADPAANIAHASAMVREAAAGQPDLILLPELWSTGIPEDPSVPGADESGVPAALAMRNLAAELNIPIAAGSAADRRDGTVRNTARVFDGAGTEQARYDKIHLIGLMGEDRIFVPGDSPCRFDLRERPGGTGFPGRGSLPCGLMICYDLRFPELARTLALAGARLLLVPAAWPKPRLHPWRILAQARAIENQVFVAAANCAGRTGPYDFFGHSLVADPLGRILAEAGEEEEILFADIDLSECASVRRTMDLLSDRRPDCYKT